MKCRAVRVEIHNLTIALTKRKVIYIYRYCTTLPLPPVILEPAARALL